MTLGIKEMAHIEPHVWEMIPWLILSHVNPKRRREMQRERRKWGENERDKKRKRKKSKKKEKDKGKENVGEKKIKRGSSRFWSFFLVRESPHSL